jgi:hypothetical protein
VAAVVGGLLALPRARRTGASAATPPEGRRTARSRATELDDLRADVESLYGRLGSDVQLLAPGDDAVARQALADASERYTGHGALLAKADSPGEYAAARRTAVEGIAAARVVRQRLGLDPGPDVPMPEGQGPQLTERSRVQVGDDEYDGSPRYEPGRPHYYEGGYYGGQAIPGGWYATPFWQTLLMGSMMSGGLGGGYGRRPRLRTGLRRLQRRLRRGRRSAGAWSGGLGGGGLGARTRGREAAAAGSGAPGVSAGGLGRWRLGDRRRGGEAAGVFYYDGRRVGYCQDFLMLALFLLVPLCSDAGAVRRSRRTAVLPAAAVRQPAGGWTCRTSRRCRRSPRPTWPRCATASATTCAPWTRDRPGVAQALADASER